MIYVIIAIVSLIVIYLWKRNKKKKYNDVDIPMPDVLRDGIKYGYYSSVTGQYEKTKNEINLFWYSHFGDWNEFIDILKNTNVDIVFDIAPYLMKTENGKSVLREDATEGLTNKFNELKSIGVLHRIKYLYPCDEPSLSIKDEVEHKKILDVVVTVKSSFEELRNSKMGVIYLRESKFWNLEYFDIIGIDNYDQKSEVLTIGDHARLKAAKLPHQTMMLVPGPSFGQIPEPFVAYAHSNPEVEMVIPFIWFDRPEHKDVAYTGLEAAEPQFYQRWIDAGNKIMNK